MNNIEKQAREILRVDDVAELIGSTRNGIYKLVFNRRIPHYKPTGGRLYFKRSEIEAWLLSNRVAPMDELEQQAAAGLREGLDLDGPAPLQDAAAARQPLRHVKQPCRILRQVIVQLKKLGHGA